MLDYDSHTYMCISAQTMESDMSDRVVYCSYLEAVKNNELVMKRISLLTAVNFGMESFVVNTMDFILDEPYIFLAIDNVGVLVFNV